MAPPPKIVLPSTTPPAKLSVAPVAPGATVVNTLAPPGLVARLHADFDRDGSIAATDPEAQVRLLRPGAIILPNLDINDLSRVPAVPPGGPPQDLEGFLDFKDTIVGGASDLAQLTATKFEFPASIASRASTIAMRIDPKDNARIRTFLAASVATFTFFPPTAFDTTSGDLITLNFSGIDVTMLIEALAPPGDPRLTSPTGPSPIKPAPFAAKLPAGSTGSPVFAKRAPGDVWIELVHKDSGGKEIARPRDVALFTIAPVLLLPGSLPPKRVFVVNSPDVKFGSDIIPGNQNFVFDLAEGCQAVFGAAAVPLPASESAPFTPATPTHTGPFYLIDGTKCPDPGSSIGLPDPWIQDEIEIGYCFAPHGSMHVVLHCKRNRGLHNFVHQEMPAPAVGLYDGLHAPGPNSDSVNYGGNIEATPPIKVATPALAAGAAGPSVKAHRPAPFGKIILGDSGLRKVEADYREFLLAQTVQPVLPVDTSWLAVGHVDEFISFVADRSPKGFKMLSASVGAMTVLLEETKKVPIADGRTNFHRGKWTDSFKPKEAYDEISVEDLLKDSKPFNDRLRADHLIPIDQRLKSGLSLTEADIIRMPTYFTPPVVSRPRGARPGVATIPKGFRTVAQTVGSVNMLVLGQHLMIPKPFGPRMKTADAEAVLKRVFTKLGVKASVVLPPIGEVRWVEPNERPERMVCYYTDPPTQADRENIIAHIKDPAVALSPSNTALVLAKAAELAAVPANVSNGLLMTQLASLLTATPAPVWFRVTIPDNKVDVVEAFLLSVLSPVGVTVHFVDDWFYHFSMGEAHCATNCMRELPENNSPQRWWDTYDPSVDIRYSP